MDDANQAELEAVEPQSAAAFSRYFRTHAEAEFGDEFVLPDDQAQKLMLDVGNWFLSNPCIIYFIQILFVSNVPVTQP